MNSTAFWSELESRIQKYDLLCHPFYKAWSAGTLTRDDLRQYAADYFPQVAGFPACLDEFAARLESSPLRCAVEQNRDDENGIGSPDRRSHAELWLDFAEGMGGHRTPTANPLPEVKALTGFFHSIAREGAPAAALAAFYAYESQVPRVAKEKARGLRELYSASAKTCSYFTLHTNADVYHSQVWRQLLDEQLQNASPKLQEKTLDAAAQAAQMLWRALDGIERRRQLRAALN